MILVVHLFLGGCQDSSFNAYRVTKHLIGKQINMNWKYEMYPNDKDISNNPSNYKVIIHIPEHLCITCLTTFIDSCKRYAKKYESEKLCIYLILDCKNEEFKKVKTLLAGSNNVYVINDINQSFLKKNSIEKYTDYFHSFLLDHNNKILLIGNPIRSKRIFDLFDKQIMHQ